MGVRVNNAIVTVAMVVGLAMAVLLIVAHRIVSVDNNDPWVPSGILIEPSAPAYVESALATAAKRGVTIPYPVIRRDATEICDGLPCSPDHIVVMLWTQSSADCALNDSCEVGHFTRRGRSCTIEVPPNIKSVMPVGADLPADPEALMLAHEVQHCMGYGHAYLRLTTGIIMEPTGHLMNPRLSDSGWSTQGM